MCDFIKSAMKIMDDIFDDWPLNGGQMTFELIDNYLPILNWQLS